MKKTSAEYLKIYRERLRKDNQNGGNDIKFW